MKNRIRESLSALCDGECDELELRRALNHVENDAELREQWSNFHLIGAAMRGESIGTVDLSRGIMQAIDGEPMDDVPAAADQGSSRSSAVAASQPDLVQPSKPALPAWMISGSVAASVTLAVLFGARALTSPDVGVSGDLSAQPVMAAVSSEIAPAGDTASFVSDVTVSAVASDTTADRSATASLSEEELAAAQETLRQYVLEHEDHGFGARVQQASPFARVANFGQDTGIRDRVRAEVQQGVNAGAGAE
ncbi:sigma-E factor negative regulatory protein [Thalassolituus maritimus]|uniref:Anti sigma-E protein RseA N-terminal domain-containing protein n=1 Tax=Thalassolituus maritimus TaxID=484498 RepID=A0ABP9ZVI0_9GAMM